MKIKKRALTNSILLNLLVAILIIYIAGPFVWVISASFQGENELLKKPPSFIPKNPTTDNYRYVFTGAGANLLRGKRSTTQPHFTGSTVDRSGVEK